MTATPAIQPAAIDPQSAPQPSRNPRLTSPTVVVRNAALTLVTQGWIFLVLIVAIPQLVRYLGDKSFGLFSLAWVMIGYLTFLDIGVNRAATKFISERLSKNDPDAAREIVRTGIVANLALGLAGGAAVALLSPYLVHSIFKISPEMERQTRWAFYAVSLAVPVLLMQGIFRATLSSFQRFGWINVVDAFATGTQWVAAVILARKGYGVALVVLATVGARVLAMAAYGIIVQRLVSGLRLFHAGSLQELPKLLHFGGWVTVSQVVSPILVYLDRVLIASFVSLAAVTLYTVPYEAMTRVQVIPSALVGTLYPAFSEHGGEDRQIRLERLYERSVRYLMLLLLPGLIYLFILGSDLFGVWMGASFARKISGVLQVLALGVLVNALASVPYSLLQASGRPDLTGKFHLAEVPVYIALCIVLTQHWGITGAALASTIRFVLDAVLLFWAAGKYCRCPLRRFGSTALFRILPLSCVLAIALCGIRLVVNAPWPRLALGLLAVAFWLLPVWIFAVDREEKPRIRGTLKTFLGQAA